MLIVTRHLAERDDGGDDGVKRDEAFELFVTPPAVCGIG